MSDEKGKMTAEEKCTLALSLLRRCGGVCEKLADNLAKSASHTEGKSVLETRLDAAERYLEHAYELVGEFGPDTEFWRDAYLLDGRHAVLTEEGWEPVFENSDFEGIEILDEVNERPTVD